MHAYVQWLRIGPSFEMNSSHLDLPELNFWAQPRWKVVAIKFRSRPRLKKSRFDKEKKTAPSIFISKLISVQKSGMQISLMPFSRVIAWRDENGKSRGKMLRYGEFFDRKELTHVSNYRKHVPPTLMTKIAAFRIGRMNQWTCRSFVGVNSEGKKERKKRCLIFPFHVLISKKPFDVWRVHKKVAWNWELGCTVHGTRKEAKADVQ